MAVGSGRKQSLVREQHFTSHFLRMHLQIRFGTKLAELYFVLAKGSGNQRMDVDHLQTSATTGSV